MVYTSSSCYSVHWEVARSGVDVPHPPPQHSSCSPSVVVVPCHSADFPVTCWVSVSIIFHFQRKSADAFLPSSFQHFLAVVCSLPSTPPALPVLASFFGSSDALTLFSPKSTRYAYLCRFVAGFLRTFCGSLLETTSSASRNMQLELPPLPPDSLPDPRKLHIPITSNGTGAGWNPFLIRGMQLRICNSFDTN